VCAPTLLAELPELGRLSRREIASWWGWRRSIATAAPCAAGAPPGGGRASVRGGTLYGDLTAVRHNPALKVFYGRLLAAGKPKKAALTAAMRKLLLILNAILKTNSPWRPPCPA